MPKTKTPNSRAVQALKKHKVPFEASIFEYVEKGGTGHSAEVLGVDEHGVIKTLIFEDPSKKPLCVLMHGDKRVSAKALARHLKLKSVSPCDPAVAQRHSGYQVGGTSPFGLRKPMPIYVERTILELPEIFINGGGRGLLVRIAPADIAKVVDIELVDVATD